MPPWAASIARPVSSLHLQPVFSTCWADDEYQARPNPTQEPRLGTSTAFVIHPDVRTMPLPRSADAMLAEAVQLVGAIGPVSYTHLTLPTKA